MENTLEAGLARLFGGAAPREPAPTDTRGTAAAETAVAAPASTNTSPELAALAAEARAHYERAVQAQRQGDWATYGEELRRLGQTLERMKAR
jgi:uncharacterized membrane protein (UPF0182 family)